MARASFGALFCGRMTRTDRDTPTARQDPLWARPWLVLGVATLAIHLAFNNGYDIYRDELYFIVCGLHPAIGYVDQPPLVPWIAGASYSLFGESLMALRLLPALMMTCTVALTCEGARILGGRQFAQWLAGLCVMTGSVYLINGYLLMTDFMQPLTWLGASLCLVKVIQTGNQRWWLGFGAVVGVSLLSKYLISFYLLGLAVGILTTPLRRSLLSPWLYLGALLALAIGSPSLIWQAQHGVPFLELGKSGIAGKNEPVSAPEFLIQQLLVSGVAGAPVWLAGLWRFAVRPPLPAYRAFPIAWVTAALAFLALHGKAYYLTPIYPFLLAGGAVAVEGWLRRPALRGAILGAIAVIGCIMAPFALPILPPAGLAAYSTMLGVTPKMARVETYPLGILPQQLGDQLGWREMAAKVAAIYNALPPADRARAAFFGRNYGEAAAIDLYARRSGVPPAISGHNAYFLWGPMGHDGSVLIMVGGERAGLERLFQSVEERGTVSTPFAVPRESNLPIYVLRGPRIPMAQLWPLLKHYE